MNEARRVAKMMDEGKDILEIRLAIDREFGG